MKLLVTGANGFLGQHVVEAAAARGHQVRALVRPATKSIPPSWEGNPSIEVARADLRARNLDPAILDGIDCVLHLAASKAGDLHEQFGGTVIAAENLLAAMVRAGVTRLVLTSSFSVYEYLRLPGRSLLDESAPLAVQPEQRDEYCQTKLFQERIVREAVQANGWRCVILRPGVVFGHDNLWSARLGIQAGRWWIRTGANAPLPLTYAENCAEAVALAAEYDGPEKLLTLNVVDDQTPKQKHYMRALQGRWPQRPRIFPVPWWTMRSAARAAWLTNRILFRGTAKVPGLFVPARLHARCKPLRYTNEGIRQTLGWAPRYTWTEGIDRSLRRREHTPATERSPEPPEPSPARRYAEQTA